MEKYGVDEDLTTEKEAEHRDKQKCPKCDAPLRDPKKTGVLVCPNCGSLPFEKK